MKYKKLSKEEKSKIKKEFAKSAKGKKLLPSLNRLLLEGIACQICAIIILVCTFIFEMAWWNYFLIGTLIVGGLIFLFAQHKIKINEYNKIIDTKKKK